VSIVVPREVGALYRGAAQVAHPGSATQYAMPAAHMLAHLSGSIMAGPLIASRRRTPAAGTSQTYYAMVHRHPSCTHLHAWVVVGAAVQSSAEVTLTAGTGTPVTRSAYFPGTPTGTVALEVVAAWDAADAGYCEVTVAGTDIGFYAVFVFPCYRVSLGDEAGDIVVLPYDSSATRGGLAEGHVILDSAEAGMRAFVEQSDELWKAGLRQVVAWSGAEVASAGHESWMTIGAWRYRARQKKTEGTNIVRAYVRYRVPLVDGEMEGSLRLVSGSDSTTVSGLTSVAPVWVALTDVDCDCTATDTLTVESIVTEGSVANILVSAVSIIEDDGS